MSDLLSLFAAELKRLVSPLALAADNDVARAALFGALGWRLDSLTGFPVNTLVTTLGTIATDVETLATAVATPPQSLADITALTGKIGQNIDAIRALSDLASDPNLATPPAVTQALGALGEDLLDFLVGEYLFRYHPVALHVLELLTLGTPPDISSLTPGITGSGTQPVLRYPTARATLNLGRLSALLTDPVGTLRTSYLGAGLSTPDDARAAANLIFSRVAPLLAATGATVTVGINQPGAPAGLDPQRALSLQYRSPDSSASTGVGALLQILAQSEGGPGLSVTPSGVVNATWNLPTWTVDLTASAAIGQFIVVASGATLQQGSAAASLSLSVEYLAADNVPAAVIGVPLGTSLQIGSATVTGQVATSASGQQVGVELKLSNCVVALASGDGDGFLATVLPADGLTTSFSLDLGWATNRGVYLGPGTGLSCTVPVNTLAAGFLLIDSLDLAITPGTGGSVGVVAAMTGGLTLGPFAVTVSQVGIEAQVSFPPGSGNLGVANLDKLGFKPPDGLGLALDAAPVSGAGFVAYDEVNARYLGALALSIGDVGISAVGVLDTRLPGGAPGYSLIIVASAGFPPVELGFGFSLVGIGGLVGVNRTTDVPSLQALARAGTLDSLLFPADLAHRAPQVAASLEQVFPAEQGHFIVGPAARVEWGTTGIIDAEVGVFIELTDSGGGLTLLRVALLGWVHLTLPDAVDTVADLTLDVLGVADLTAKTLSLDAGLRNSSIAGFPLTGQAALRASWGTSPSFVLAVGGFNPHFAVPAGFPALQRLSLSIGGNDPRLRLSAYLALTSNTVQFGCSADLYASAGPAAVSASLKFDALIQLKPFGLAVDLTTAATVLLGGSPVLSVGLDLHVSGPEPWVVTGSASFQIFLCSFTVPIAITVGPQPPPQPPQTVDLDGNLTTALGKLQSWQTGPPAGRGVVTVRGQNGASTAVHPLATLTVRQSAVPLEQRIERYGPDLLDQPCTYQITAATVQVTGGVAGGTAPPATDVTDFFAPAQFLTMTDAQKLSAPSFEPMAAGLTLGSAALTLPQRGTAATVVDTHCPLTWDMVLADSPDPTTAAASAVPAAAAPASPVTLPDALLAAQLPGAAAAVNGALGRGQARYAAPGSGIAVKPPTYAVVGMGLTAPGATPVLTMEVPSAAAAAGSLPAGAAAGQAGQVVYTSEVPGSWAL